MFKYSLLNCDKNITLDERAGLRRPTPSCSVFSTLSDYVPDMTPFPGKSQKPQIAPPPLE